MVTSHTDADWHAWCPTCGWADSFPIKAWVGREGEITAAMNRSHVAAIDLVVEPMPAGPYHIRHDYDGTTPIYVFVCEECGDEDGAYSESEARTHAMCHEHSMVR